MSGVISGGVPMKVSKVPAEAFVVKSGDTPLQTPWTIHWWRQSSWGARRTEADELGDERAAAAKSPLFSKERADFLEHVKQLGTFNSIEGLWRHYLHLKKASRMEMGLNVAVFRAQLQPAWESFPNGGCWIIRVPKSAAFLDRLWEELLVAVTGERFLTPELVGIVVSVRREYTNITVWNRDNSRSAVRFRIGERLKNILNLADDSTVDYKEFSKALVDKSTHRNATAFTYTTMPASVPAAAVPPDVYYTGYA